MYIKAEQTRALVFVGSRAGLDPSHVQSVDTANTCDPDFLSRKEITCDPEGLNCKYVPREHYRAVTPTGHSASPPRSRGIEDPNMIGLSWQSKGGDY